MSTLSKKKAEVKSESLQVGVDLALDHNQLVILSDQRQRLDRFGFDHSRQGYDDFYQRVEAVRQRVGATQVLVGMEPTNYFWKLLASDMEDHRQPYRLVNSFTVRKHREGDQLDYSRDDVRDGTMIADLLCSGKYTRTQLLHGSYAELRGYASLYQRLVDDTGRQKTLVRVMVGQAFPELHQVFKDLSGATCQALLRQLPCAAHIRCFSEAEFLARVRQSFSGRRLYGKKLRRAYQLAQVSVGLKDGLSALHCEIRLHLDTLDLLQQQLQEVTQALVDTFQALPEAHFWLSIPGIGPVTAALLLAEIGNPQAYTRVGQWIKLAGTQPTPDQSGRKSRSKTPMSGKGRARLRTYVYFACLRLIQLDPGFAQRYQQLQQRPKNPLTKLQAIGVLMNKLLRVLWALSKKQSRYDPTLAWAGE